MPVPNQQVEALINIKGSICHIYTENPVDWKWDTTLSTMLKALPWISIFNYYTKSRR